MEIIVLILVWLVATFSASENEFGFALFLVFSSLAGMAWLWRSRIAKLNETIEKDAKEVAGLRSELKTLTQELRLMKARFESGATAHQPTATPPTKAIADAAVSSFSVPPKPMASPEPVKPIANAIPVETTSAAKPIEIPKSEPRPIPPAPAPVRPAVTTAGFAASQISIPSQVHTAQAARPSPTAGPTLGGITSRANNNVTSAPHKLKKSLDLEELVGRNLLPKAGIFLLVIGSVSLIATQWQNIPAFGKDLLLLAAGGLLLGLGIFLEKKEKYELFGRVLIGGGWAMLFYTSYALYHVNATRVLPTQWIDLVIMLGTAAVMVWHTLKYRSQVVTGIAYLLAFSTVTISQETVFSLSAGTVL